MKEKKTTQKDTTEGKDVFEDTESERSSGGGGSNNNGNQTTTIILQKTNSTFDLDSDIIYTQDLRKNDKKVLKTLLNEKMDDNSSMIFTFNGLKNKLNIHQEVLSRSLRRLKDLSLIENDNKEYRLTSFGRAISSKLTLEEKSEKVFSNSDKENIEEVKSNFRKRNIQIVQVYLPFKIDLDRLTRDLSGRWFKNLRWIGKSKNITGYRLIWKDSENFYELRLFLAKDYIIIETNAEKDKLPKAFSSSSKILERISKILDHDISYISTLNTMISVKHNKNKKK